MHRVTQAGPPGVSPDRHGRETAAWRGPGPDPDTYSQSPGWARTGQPGGTGSLKKRPADLWTLTLSRGTSILARCAGQRSLYRARALLSCTQTTWTAYSSNVGDGIASAHRGGSLHRVQAGSLRLHQDERVDGDMPHDKEIGVQPPVVSKLRHRRPVGKLKAAHLAKAHSDFPKDLVWEVNVIRDVKEILCRVKLENRQ